MILWIKRCSRWGRATGRTAGCGRRWRGLDQGDGDGTGTITGSFTRPDPTAIAPATNPTSSAVTAISMEAPLRPAEALRDQRLVEDWRPGDVASCKSRALAQGALESLLVHHDSSPMLSR